MSASKDQVAQLIFAEAKARGWSRNFALAIASALYQESQWDDDVWDKTHVTFGIAQQDGSYKQRFDGAAAQVKGFFDKLAIWIAKPGASDDMWLNICWMQQRPNWPSAQYWLEHGRTAYLTEIKSRIATVTPYLDRYWPVTAPIIPPPPIQEPSTVSLSDPFTGAVWSPNRYHPRDAPNPRWIAIHTQEGGRSARDLAAFLANPASQVSYHACNDDKESLKIVAEQDAPWAAAGANNLAFHLCLAGSYSAWSRGKWLETDSSDGTNEDLELTDAAKIVAWWCQKYNIPAEYIGGNGIPWGKDGICGHVDFGAWGGGHHDPGLNFPWDELIRRVKAFLAGAPVPPPVVVVPVGPGGGAPVDPATSQYFTGLLYRGVRGQDAQVRELQRRLSAAFGSYAGHLPIDGDFGDLTDAAVREFQRRSHLIVDGIVGPQTAAAMKLKRV